MSEQKIYVFTTDHLLTIEGDEREIKEGWLIFMDFDSEWLLRTSGRACIIIPNKVIDELLQSGTIIDYPEPTMVSNDLTGVELKTACDKVEALEKELNESNKALISLTKLYCYQSIKLEELKNDRDLNTAGTHVDPSAFEPGGFMNQPSEKIKN
jgi:hypothetical protein